MSLRFRRVISVFFFLISFFALNFSIDAQELDQGNQIDFFIRNSIEKTNPEQKLLINGNELFSSVVMPRFYLNREFLPAWSQNGKLLEIAYEMRYEIQQVKFHGLNPNDYHLQAIQNFFEKYESLNKSSIQMEDGQLASLDVLLTDAYFMISSHIYLGKVNPENLKAEWNIQRSAPEVKIDDRLQKALENESIRKSLEELFPTFSVYKKMSEGMRKLFEYQKLFESIENANWEDLRDRKAIKRADTNNQIPEIRKRLIFYGYMDSYQFGNEKLYDSIMESGIKKLQKLYGLNTDGVIGEETFYALNQTPKDLIMTASVNLERFRWLPANIKEQELILVNTANFQLDYIQKRDTLLSSKVIIGKEYNSTPQFSEMMSYLVFSPTWTIPRSIIRNEIIPAAKKDPDYFSKKKMQVLTSSGQTVDPKTINWSTVNSKNFPYTVRQTPGEHNSMGLVKFMFPNKYSVYIHDTPARSLFDREDRALSHGCIRLEKPKELASLLLAEDPSWTMEKIESAMRQRQEQSVTLNRDVPVVILYITYWANAQGEMFFRRDLYSRDAEIYQALKESRGLRSGV